MGNRQGPYRWKTDKVLIDGKQTRSLKMENRRGPYRWETDEVFII